MGQVARPEGPVSFGNHSPPFDTSASSIVLSPVHMARSWRRPIHETIGAASFVMPRSPMSQDQLMTVPDPLGLKRSAPTVRIVPTVDTEPSLVGRSKSVNSIIIEKVRILDFIVQQNDFHCHSARRKAGRRRSSSGCTGARYAHRQRRQKQPLADGRCRSCLLYTSD